MTQKAVLLLNLGTPDSTQTGDVRRYLRQFLMDGRVIYCAPWLRWIIVNLLICPTRPKDSAAAYKRIWTDQGSPLLLTSQEQQKILHEAVNLPVELGMRYGNPSTEDAMKRLHEQGAQDIFVIPLYPHYAMSSYETAVVAAREAANSIDPSMNITFMPPFYNEDGYIESLLAVAQPFLANPYDRILFSYHGIPEKHLKITDPTSSHCLQCEHCCEAPSAAHATCYRHQCFTTTRLFCEKANIPKERYQISFQSRLGRDPWLTPYTDFTLEELPNEGVKNLLMMCPAFVSDNLETLEEIAMEGKETFLEAGGESFTLIPCLNTSPRWMQYLQSKVEHWLH